jgi:hypothetical protein
MYLPMAGWAMLLAALLVAARDGLWKMIGNRATMLSRALPALLALAVVVWVPAHDPVSRLRPVDPGQQVIGGMTDDIQHLAEPLPKGARVLFLHDRFPADDVWGTVMICRLLYRDPSLWADRATLMKHAPDQSAYDRVFDYDNGRLIVRARRR